MLKAQHYKLLSLFSLAIFLFTVLQPISLVLLALTGFFSYLYLVRLISELGKGDFMGLVPNKWRRYFQSGKFADYVASLQIVKATPVLSYLLPLLKPNSLTKTEHSLQKYQPLHTSLVQNQPQSIQNSHLLSQQLSQHQSIPTHKLSNSQSFSKKKHLLLQNTYKRLSQKIKEDQPATFTTCESNSKYKRTNSQGIGSRKSSYMIMKRKFAEEETSSTDQKPFEKEGKLQNKVKLHKSISENKLALQKLSLNAQKTIQSTKQHSLLSNKASLTPPHPLKTIEQYLQALIWMMKRLLGLRKMSSKLKRTSMIKLTVVACILWVCIVLQIKIDSKKGKLLFRTLRALIGVSSVFAALGVTCMLGWKIHRRLTQGEQPPRKPPQSILYERK